MSDKTLGNARGLNSIANPKDFKGTKGRFGRQSTRESPPEPVLERRLPEPPREPQIRATPEDERRPGELPPRERPHTHEPPTSDRRPENPSGPNPNTDPDPRSSRSGSTRQAVAQQALPHRAARPGVQRTRRELSVPHQIADAVEASGINAADIVMAGYRRHSDDIYTGAGGRMAARGRRRLRLSISDQEFDQITRLGQARGWNRSETVSVILAMELMPKIADLPRADPNDL